MGTLSSHLPQRTLQQRPGQVALVLGAAVDVVRGLAFRIDDLGDALSGRLELADALVDQLVRGTLDQHRHVADGSHRHACLTHHAFLQPDLAADRCGRALDERQLAIDNLLARPDCRQPDRGEQLVRLQRGGQGLEHELVDAHLAPLVGSRQLERGVGRQQEGRRVGVRFGEAQVAADAAHVAHPHVGHLALHLDEARVRLGDQRGALELAVRRRRADAQAAIVESLDAAQLVDALQVGQVLEAGEAHLHRLQQLGAAAQQGGIGQVAEHG
jgi:hypothetical protein